MLRERNKQKTDVLNVTQAFLESLAVDPILHSGLAYDDATPHGTGPWLSAHCKI